MRCICLCFWRKTSRRLRVRRKMIFFYLTENFFILFSCVVKINKIIYCHGSQCSAPCSSLKSYKWIIFLFFWNALIFFFFMIDFTFSHMKLYFIEFYSELYGERKKERTCGIDFYHYFSMLPYGRFYFAVWAYLRDESRPWSFDI